ncbi:MAG: M16 family metallopeptidase [Desulfovibrionaceae bacterium]
MVRRTVLLGLLLGGLLVTLGCAAKSGPQAQAQAPAPRAEAGVSGIRLADDLAKVDRPDVIRLENGLTVLIKQDKRFPLANVRLYVHAGSAYEKPEQAGISHLLEHMVFKGTTDRPKPGEIAMQVESAGGSLNAGTSWDYTVFYVEVPSDAWKLGMDVVQDMAFHARIAPEDLKTERHVVLSEIQRADDNPGNLVFRTLQGRVFKGTSYQWPILGFTKTVSGFSAQDIRDYVAEHYQPQSMLLVVVGDVDPQAVIAQAKATLDQLKNTRPITPQPAFSVPARGEGPSVTVIPGQWNKVYLGIAFPIPDLYSSRSVGLEALGQLLGGDDTSLLYRTFKYDKRLVDDISAYAFSLDRVGVFYISATLDADKVDQFWRELMTELADLDPEKFTDQELERAKLNLADSLFQAKETLSGLASKLGSFQFYYGGQYAEANYLFDLTQLTRGELSELARQYLRPDQLSACLLTPQADGNATSPISAQALTDAAKTLWPDTAPAAPAAAAENGAQTTEIALPGGSRLVLLPDDTLPYTALSIYWPGGDGELTPDQQGLASLTAQVLTRGTEQMTATQIEDFLSDRAASVGASAGRDTFALNAKFPAWYADDILPLVSDMLTGPTWPLKEVDLAKEDQTAAIRLREDKPLGLAFRHLFPFLYQDGPYAYMTQGDPDGIARFAPGDVKAYWDRQSRLPFVAAVCGQFDPARLQAFADALAARLTTPGAAYAYDTPTWGADHQRTLPLPDRNQAHVLVVFPAAGTNDEQASAGLDLMRAVLAGQSGLLFRDLREDQGLGYTVTAFLWQAPKTGFLAFYIGTEPGKVDQAMQGFREVAQRLRSTPLPDAELTRAKNILAGEYYQDHQSLLSRSRQAASLMTQGYPRTREAERIERSKTLTAKDLQDLAAHTLDMDHAYVMQVLP